MYHNFYPRNLKSLQNRINHVAKNIDQAELARAVKNVPQRLQMVKNQDGGHFEHLL